MKASLVNISDFTFSLALTPDDTSETSLLLDMMNMEGTMILQPVYGLKGPSAIFLIGVGLSSFKRS